MTANTINKPYEIRFTNESDTLQYDSIDKMISDFDIEKFSNLGIDLSGLTILRSDQIGLIAKAIKNCASHGRKPILLVTEDLIDAILKSIHLDRKIIITRDRKEFERRLGMIEVIPVNASHQGEQEYTPVPALQSENKPVVLTIGIFVSMFILLLVIFILTQNGALQKQKLANTLIVNQLEKALDSIETLSDKSKAEQELLNQLIDKNEAQGKGSQKNDKH